MRASIWIENYGVNDACNYLVIEFVDYACDLLTILFVNEDVIMYVMISC